MYIIIKAKDENLFDHIIHINILQIFIGGFDQDYNIVFLKDATVTENEEMHKVELKIIILY